MLKKISERRYRSLDGHYLVTLELSGEAHGAVTIEDTAGESLRDTHGDRPVRKVCRCGGLETARILVGLAMCEPEW